ncbi:hypothetical protein [Phenylobacterium sp.]|uniref:hypothetical protein n=1 Tax=Phenylobacterium sp. TaxID=1871053 RepID=UPI002DE4796D|nr:hypothetical protein [Phenylobacterium sp.]
MSENPRPRRRLPIRWLSLAELVGIAALVIAGLGWWDNHREREQQDRERIAAARSQSVQARREALRSTFLLVGNLGDDAERIRLSSAHPDQVIQTQTLVFPAAVRGDPVETTGNPRIDRRWLEDGLKKADRDRKPDAGGERRVPVGIVTSYVEAGEMKTDRSLYAVAYTLQSRLLRGSTVKLEGVSLLRRGVSGDLKAAVESAWRR